MSPLKRVKEDLYWIRHGLKKRWYLRGRQKINGQRLRYDAASDIPMAVLLILEEYETDCHSPYFQCEHADDLERIEPLITEGRELAEDGWPDPEKCQAWLQKVTDILPFLWD